MMTLPDTYSQDEKIELERQFDELLRCWKSRKNEQDVGLVTEAFLLAANAHKNQRRRSGEPYMYHPLAVATIIASEMGVGRTSIICALLHDVVEDTEYTLDYISEHFGEKVAKIVDGVTKLTNEDLDMGVHSPQAETFRKVIMSMSVDIRVILVKLADRLHNMRTLSSMPHHKQLKIASETTQIYAPIAYRLGLYRVKIELDDLCLKYINPSVYESVQKQLEGVREKKINELEEFLTPVREELERRGIKVRTKVIERNVSSVWERMVKFGMSLEEVYDVYVVRIIIDCPNPEDEKIQCWETFAVFTKYYYPDNKKMRDWVSFPKTNGYSSIHAVFMNKKGNWVETQIRTERMDETAENGFAAYWKYRDQNSNAESGLDLWMKVVRNLVQQADENHASAIEFIDSFKLDLFNDEIFVFTPKGDKITLPKGSTVLDFAYNIHTDLGNHCVGANINRKLSPIHTELKMGDQVEIITSEYQEPQEKWFEYLATSSAKSRLKNGIKDYRKLFKDKGKTMLKEYFDNAKIDFSKQNRNTLAEKFNLANRNDLYYMVATNKIGQQDVESVLKKDAASWSEYLVKYLTLGIVRPSSERKNDKAEEKTEENNVSGYVISTCCNPIPGDDVVAIQLPGQPIQIHHPDCVEAQKLMSRFGESIVKARLQFGDDFAFLATLKILAVNKMGLGASLFDIITNQEKLDMQAMEMKIEGGMVVAIVSVYVNNLKTLENLIDKIKKLELVKKVERVGKRS
ncbi:MAG: bifunctional (p)ppGpp synthetase/guanosine-3',5'-bis(diphosphate) 3'-pyrophosphohydrolase [Bacteroidales bacterium]|nr:bifunctional (p)ppGpp synthetase/guanosine-3',5'-bis(diphosphate) 3'-pyrophosphohydrolase [Bacteroidales bacterium]